MVSCYPEILLLSCILQRHFSGQSDVTHSKGHKHAARDASVGHEEKITLHKRSWALGRVAQRDMDLHPWTSSKLFWVRPWTSWPSQEASSALRRGLDQLPSRADSNLSLFWFYHHCPGERLQPQPPETFCWVHLHPSSASSDTEVLHLVIREAPVPVQLELNQPAMV